jgi:hypothetical protein
VVENFAYKSQRAMASPSVAEKQGPTPEPVGETKDLMTLRHAG